MMRGVACAAAVAGVFVLAACSRTGELSASRSGSRGGWPLSVFTTPEGKPFFAGTFFPAEDGYGRKGFKSILREIAGLWREERGRMLKTAEEVTSLLRSTPALGATVELDERTQDKAYRNLLAAYDDVYGGFGVSPKFPTSHNLTFLLGYWKRTGEPAALEMVDRTLDRVERGGIHDHVGGGFHRYSTDRQWLVPHFEKMLYDQALLARAYILAYQATGEKRYADAARDIFGYVLRDMTHPGGGFYTAQDAETGGEEGKYYVWKKKEIDALLGADAAIFEEFYGVTEAGNFDGGTNVLHMPRPREDFYRVSGYKRERIDRALERGKKALLEARAKRKRPHVDDKVLASWNGLMISALSLGARVLDEPRYANAGRKAAVFVLKNLRRDGTLYRRYRDGEAAVPAFLDDYAFLAMGLIDLYEATFELKWLIEARKLADEMIKKFRDAEKGGFLLTQNKGEKLIAEIKEAYDGAEPSGDSVAALLLLKLSRFTMNDGYETAARGIFDAFSGQIAARPEEFTQMLAALDFAIGPSREIVIAGAKDDPATREMLRIVNGEFLPNKIIVLNPGGGKDAKIESVIPLASMKEMIGGKTTAFVCVDFTCRFPTNDAARLRELLRAPAGSVP
ncbi:MAG: thioredoxin domain-containing protein [bacterium]